MSCPLSFAVLPVLMPLCAWPVSRSIETSLGGSGRIGAWGLEDDSDNECPEDQKGGDEWRNDEDVEDPHQRAILQKETPAILVDSPDLLDIVAVDDNETKTSNDSGMPGFEIVVRPSSPSPEEQRPVSLVPSPRSPSVSPAKSLASQESITPVRAHTRGPSMRKHPRLQGTERYVVPSLSSSLLACTSSPMSTFFVAYNSPVSCALPPAATTTTMRMKTTPVRHPLLCAAPDPAGRPPHPFLPRPLASRPPTSISVSQRAIHRPSVARGPPRSLESLRTIPHRRRTVR